MWETCYFCECLRALLARRAARAATGTMSWASEFNCAGPCGRKRLIAANFSNKMLDKARRDEHAPIRCKECVEAAAAEERAVAAAKQAAKASVAETLPAAPVPTDGPNALPPPPPPPPTEQHVCSACGKTLAAEAFNRTQLAKGVGKQRCRECVEQAEKQAVASSDTQREASLAEARAALKEAEATGSAAQVLKASTTLAALEAQKVTGLKPVVLGRGRGSWRGRSGR